MDLRLDSNKTRIRILVAYDGTDFFGWQKQPNTHKTVQGVLETILSKIYNQKITVIASGRTDRGVHALNQWAHFELPPDLDHSKLQYKFRRMSPDSIVVKKIETVPADFHAQISAVSKCYKYRLISGTQLNPFQNRYTFQPGRLVNLEYLQKLAPLLLGEQDFTSFQSQGTPVNSTVRHILISRWIKRNSGLLEYQIQGSGFLKQMVRNIVGTMLKLEQLQAPSDEFSQILEAKDRGRAAAPAPPQGLFLTSVQYPKSLDNKCRKL